MRAISSKFDKGYWKKHYKIIESLSSKMWITRVVHLKKLWERSRIHTSHSIEKTSDVSSLVFAFVNFFKKFPLTPVTKIKSLWFKLLIDNDSNPIFNSFISEEVIWCFFINPLSQFKSDLIRALILVKTSLSFQLQGVMG